VHKFELLTNYHSNTGVQSEKRDPTRCRKGPNYFSKTKKDASVAQSTLHAKGCVIYVCLANSNLKK
jgi:hypothetical protein